MKIWLLLLVAVVMVTGCKQIEYVPMVETHDVHHWHTDTVRKTDSIISEKETIIRQLDSTAMAKYGIRLKEAERAWLVETNGLRRQIERLEAMTFEKDSIHDSIPVPVPVIQEVTLRQKATFWAESAIVTIVLVFVIYISYRTRKRK